jgi:thioredoxin-related protein
MSKTDVCSGCGCEVVDNESCVICRTMNKIVKERDRFRSALEEISDAIYKGDINKRIATIETIVDKALGGTE